MKVTFEKLEQVLLLVRFILIASALVILFVFELPALAVLVATGALLIRMALFVPAIRAWLTERFAVEDDRQNKDGSKD